MQNNNSGAIIFVLLGFIGLGLLGYYAWDVTNKATSLEANMKNLIQQIDKLGEDKQALEKELSESNIDRQTALQKIEKINQNITYVRNQLVALGLWDSLDENSKAILTTLSGEFAATPLPPTSFPNPIPERPTSNLNLRLLTRIVFTLFGVGGCGMIIFFGFKMGNSSQNVFRMKVTRKEAEVLNHLRRHRYF